MAPQTIMQQPIVRLQHLLERANASVLANTKENSSRTERAISTFTNTATCRNMAVRKRTYEIAGCYTRIRRIYECSTRRGNRTQLENGFNEIAQYNPT